MPYKRLIELLREADPKLVEPFIQKRIIDESINLQIHSALGNESECLRSKHRIADSKIISLILSGDLKL